MTFKPQFSKLYVNLCQNQLSYSFGDLFHFICYFLYNKDSVKLKTSIFQEFMVVRVALYLSWKLSPHCQIGGEKAIS